MEVKNMSLLEKTTQKKSSEQTCIIGEQGDLGLWNTPLSDTDQKVYNEQQVVEEEDKKKK